MHFKELLGRLGFALFSKIRVFVSSGASRKDRSHDGQGALEPERTLQRPGHHQGPGEKVDQVSDVIKLFSFVADDEA